MARNIASRESRQERVLVGVREVLKRNRHWLNQDLDWASRQIAADLTRAGDPCTEQEVRAALDEIKTRA
ncbi:hypothetical protein [Nonomuraea wenchangensis]|uniref:Uncharacterized protein n=1 Tax=Nonomuraea wenchangensis TaxID=568860 RepID=A0A1I0EQA4_9ACTN|nr:hypothetical protein [Nonomuraea wenchangensis]SET47470.1 hypothetical protein SAMN05421811_103153 [Nonomuraea wenchangensis]